MSPSTSTAAGALALGVLAAFFATAVPGPIWYLPLDHVTVIGDKPHALVVIDYYSRVVVVVVGLLAGAIGGRVLAPRFTARALSLTLAWAALAGALVVGLSAFQLWGRALHPLVLPASIAPSSPTVPP